MLKRLMLTSGILLQAILLISQQIIPAGSPEAAGFSTQRLQRLDKAMTEWVEKGWMQGAAAMVVALTSSNEIPRAAVRRRYPGMMMFQFPSARAIRRARRFSG